MKEKYIIIDDCKDMLFTHYFNTCYEAIREGNKIFEALTKTDRNRRKAFFLLKTVNPDKEAENHFDGEILKFWKYYGK